MATPVSIAIRRDEALARAEAAAQAIASATGAEIAPFPEPHKQEAMRPAVEAEWLADALEAIAAAVPATAPDAPQTPPDDDDATSDTHTTNETQARAAVVETVKAKAKGR